MKDLITVGLDGTLQSLSAALWAAREAELRKARLRLLHAWILLGREPTGAPPTEAEEDHWPHPDHRGGSGSGGIVPPGPSGGRELGPRRPVGRPGQGG